MMIDGISSALSGIQAGGRILSTGAHNIANAHTEGFKRTRAIAEEAPNGGVIVSLGNDTRSGPQFFFNNDPVTLREGSNVDLGEELITSLEAGHLVEANVASFQTQDKVLGALLDILE